MLPDVKPSADARSALRNAWPDHQLSAYPDNRRRMVIEADLSVVGGLLVRSAPAGPDAPDAVHLQSAGRSVLPGTSLASVLRARALRIAKVVRDAQNDAEQWVEGIFGPKQYGSPGQKSLTASRLRVTESVIENGERARPSRIRIDRFTQGVFPGALFDEEPEYGGKLKVRLELRFPKPGEVGLIFLTLKDFLSGDLPVGGTSSVGRGVLRGRATACLDDGAVINLDPDQPAHSDVELLNRKIQEFATHPYPGESS